MQLLKKKGEGTGLMVSGSIAHNIGFIKCNAAQKRQAEDHRRARIAAAAASMARGAGRGGAGRGAGGRARGEEGRASTGGVRNGGQGRSAEAPAPLPTPPGADSAAEVYRDIDMVYVDEKGDCSLFFMFEYGKNREGYWNAAKMLRHMADVIDILAITHPDVIPAFFFDWSSCHDCMQPDAPCASKMNVGVGGVRGGEEITAMRPTQLLDDYPNSPIGLKRGDLQYLTFCDASSDPPFHDKELPRDSYMGKLKGLKQVLWERGLWKPSMTKSGRKGKGNNPDLEMSMEHKLASEPDFKAVPSSLEALCERLGAICLMLPKYHCDLNPIELVWGFSKAKVRQECDYTYSTLQHSVPASLALLSTANLATVQKFCRKTHTYHAIYHATAATGMVNVADQYRKYKSHRRPKASECM